jgi:hypothetical protein
MDAANLLSEPKEKEQRRADDDRQSEHEGNQAAQDGTEIGHESLENAPDGQGESGLRDDQGADENEEHHSPGQRSNGAPEVKGFNHYGASEGGRLAEGIAVG